MSCGECVYSNDDDKALLPLLTCMRPDAPKRGGGYAAGYGVRKSYSCEQYAARRSYDLEAARAVEIKQSARIGGCLGI